MKTWAVLNDIQFPFHDARALERVLSFLEDLQPYGVILNGDVVDCYELSEFSKNPIQQGNLRREIELAHGLMARLGKVGKEHWWLGGNHEDRLRRYLWNHAERFARLEALAFEQLFGLASYGFKWKPWGGVLKLGKLIVTHGSMVAKHSGASGRAHFEKYGGSVLIGHTHRLGIFYRTDMRGVHAAYENGCLCRMNPEYVQYPNWQQGFSVVHVHPRGWFHVNQIPILQGGRFFYGGTQV